MLTVFTAPTLHPEVESLDRDPGIITLLSALVRSGGHAVHAAARHARAYHASASRLSFSSAAWPYHR